MKTPHGIIDDVFFALLLSVPLIEWKWTWPRYLKRLATGGPGVRAGFYRAMIVQEWIAAIALLVYWRWRGRCWNGLLLKGSGTPLALGIPPQMRLAAGLALAALLIAVLVAQRLAVQARPESMERVRPRLAYAEPLLPHDPKERRLFWMVSITAGVTEELFYRGFLIWYLMARMGPVAALLLSSVIFGAGHIYMGWAQAPRTGLVGAALAFLALASASLLPPMLLHAALDWNSGELAYRVLKGAGRQGASERENHETGGRE